MKISLFYIFLFFFIASNQLLSQNHWARYQGGLNNDETSALVVDANNFSYVTGYYSSNASFEGTNLPSFGLSDAFVAKYSNTGTLVWARRSGGSASDRGTGVAVDASGNVAICGFYTGTSTFEGGLTLTSNGNSQDIFIAYYNSAGEIQWVRSAGSSGSSDRANDITFDASGNVILTGQFSGEADFSGSNLSSQAGSIDVFTAKYSSSGDLLWAEKGSAPQTDRGLAIKSDNSGNVYVSGQFSESITFDNTHANTILNAIFVIKYNAQGEEQWFRIMTGSGQSNVYDMSSNGSDIFLTGDFSGTLTIIGDGPNQSFPDPHANAIYILSISNSGSVNWCSTEGSESMISARGIAFRNNKISITGRFECTLNSISEEYGEATFNSIGNRDAFISSYNSSGVWQYARNFGSQLNDDATAIGLNGSGNEIVGGTFTDKLIFAFGPALPGAGSISGVNDENLNYCGDNNYGAFKRMFGEAQLDGFLVNAIDLNREPYDYYYREGGNCDRSIPEACVRKAGAPNDILCAETDTVYGCAPYSLQAISFTGVQGQGTGVVGPNLNYQWNVPGATARYLEINTSGYYSCTITTADGCFVRSAGIFAEVYPEAEKPLISDDVVVNTEAEFPLPLSMCGPAEIELTATVPDGYTVFWTGPALDPGESDNLVITVHQSGVYHVNATSPDGCSKSNVIFIEIEYPEPPEPVMPFMLFDSDTITLCSGSNFSVTLKDSTNNSGSGDIIEGNYEVDWWLEGGDVTTGGLTNVFSAPFNGYYYINAILQLFPANYCGGDTLEYEISDSVYVQLFESPEANVTITGPEIICPGDSVMLYAEGTGNYLWSFLMGGDANYVEEFGDSALINAPGLYYVSTTVTADNGCQSSMQVGHYITETSTPEISMQPSNGLICPGGSVTLSATSSGDFVWQGPNGPLEENSDTVQVFEAGLYFAEVTTETCALVSNTLEITEYSTPFIFPNNEVLCPGGSVTLSVSVGVDGVVEWQAPLSGSGITQVVSETGTYSVSVESCGIVTMAEITVEGSSAELEIFSLEPEFTCEGDTFSLSAVGDVSNIVWEPLDLTGDNVFVLENVNLTASGTDEYGCTINSNEFSVIFTEMPGEPVLSANTICFGDEAIVNANGPFDIFWLDSLNGSVIQTGNQLLLNDSLISENTAYAYQMNQICVGPVASFAISPVPLPDAPQISSNAPVCLGEILTLTASGQTGETFRWFNSFQNFTGSNVNILPESMDYAGLYSCYAEFLGCPGDTSQMSVELFNPRLVSLPEDTIICMGREFILITDTIFQTYLWSDLSQSSTLNIVDEGVYTVDVEDFNGCKSYDEFVMELVDCNVDIPNVFTPNGDGKNDYFTITTEFPQHFRCEIYNRWGQLIYNLDAGRPVWDGTHMENGKPVPESTYYYILYLNNFEGTSYNGSGHVFLKRE